jgi:hypothetical protein
LLRLFGISVHQLKSMASHPDVSILVFEFVGAALWPFIQRPDVH